MILVYITVVHLNFVLQETVELSFIQLYFCRHVRQLIKTLALTVSTPTYSGVTKVHLSLSVFLLGDLNKHYTTYSIS